MTKLTDTSRKNIGLKNSIHQKGRICYNNGEIEIHLKPGELILDGFKKGRLPISEETRQKLREARRKRVISQETRNKTSQSMKGHSVSQETILKIKKAKKGFKYSEEQRKHLSLSHLGIKATEEAKQKNRLSQLAINSDPIKKKSKLDKSYNTKKHKNSFNTSSQEIEVEQYLKNIFGKDAILREYHEERYPFNCDFYIKSLDLFIELNLHWTHGKHEFDINNKEDIEILNKWKERAESSKFYKNAIKTWIERDVLKFQTARKNNLNYIAIYNINELYNII